MTRVEPDRNHPNGCICIKAAVAPEIVSSPDRLLQPLMRTHPKTDPDPGWTEISWERAFDLIGRNLGEIKRRYGPESVVFGRPAPAGSASKDYFPWLQRLANAFGSPNVLQTTHICQWHRDHGTSYTYGVGLPSPDIENAECILLWGFNPNASCMSEALRISRARKRGAKLIVIDPRRIGSGADPDAWLRVRPGADGALALAMIHVLLSEGLFDAAFAREWTNGPFLVRADTGALLTEHDLTASGRADAFVGWDEARGRPFVYEPGGRPERQGVTPALFGTYELALADGRPATCSTALTLLSQVAADLAPERSEGITWVPAADVRSAARMFASCKPSCYSSYVGLEEHANAMQTNRAVSLFYALTGQFDTAGSNVVWAKPPTNDVQAGGLLSREAAERRLGRSERPLGPASRPGAVQAYDVYRAILQAQPYPVRGLVMIGGNPLLANGDPTTGRRALASLDFYVHADMFLNPSAASADIVLPSCTCWESEAVRSTFDGSDAAQAWMQLRQVVVPPAGESRSDIQIIFDLAQHLGLGDLFWHGDLEAAFDHHLEPTGVTVRHLRENPHGVRVEVDQRPRKYAMSDPKTGLTRGFGTHSRLVEIYSLPFARAGYPAIPVFEAPDARLPVPPEGEEFPLVLTTAKLVQFIHANHRNIPSLRRQVPEPFVEIHPETAGGLHIGDGEWVAVQTPRGSIRLKAKFAPWLDQRVVCTQHGWWEGCKELSLPGYDPFSDRGANANLLIGNDVIDPISGSVPQRSYPCRVRKLEADPVCS